MRNCQFGQIEHRTKKGRRKEIDFLFCLITFLQHIFVLEKKNQIVEILFDGMYFLILSLIIRKAFFPFYKERIADVLRVK